MLDKYTNKIIHGDCLEIMKRLPDDCIDLVVTDPPYGKQWARGMNQVGKLKHLNEKRENLSWDNHKPSHEHFKQLFRISTNQIIFGGNYFIDELHPSNCFLIWDKIGLQDNTMPFSDIEMAWTSFNTVAKKFTLVNMGFIKGFKEQKEHPTQKPLPVIKWILQNYSKPTDLILDPFLGSGTTAVACYELGRNFIGIEKELKYIGIARRRLQAVTNQQRLFTP